MAEVRLRLRRGAYNFAHKICNRYLLESQNKQRQGAKQASSLSAAFLLGHIENGGLLGAEKLVTVGLPQDSYTRVTPPFGTVDDILGNGNVTKFNHFERYKEYSRSNKCQVERIDKVVPRYRINSKFRRTFSTSRPSRRQHGVGLCCGQFVFIRNFSDNGARGEPLYKTKTGYYDILDVSSTATHSQIKTAYYKQSFVYHPDRNSGSEEATVRFSEISEAYAVLGNKALRKKYDRGLLSQSDLIATPRPSSKDKGSSAKTQTESRRSAVGTDSRANAFDFDNFIKSHYTEQLQKERDFRSRRDKRLEEQQKPFGEKDPSKIMEVGILGLMLMAAAVLMSIK